MRLALIACLAILIPLSAPVASATEGKDSSDILGNWTFQTKPYREGQCLMTGTMRITPNEEDGLYSCELTAVEVCSMWGRSVVLQQCEARRIGDQLTIRSEIDQFLESKLEGLVYVPDNFALTIQSAKRMYGSLISAATAPAIFIRAEEGVS
ncbi:hypothetical protein [Henriciella aquimarina]|uniref:hypothetical protein n=1 Tax=Henriciella aquimarina TaxID=545261 RepID=UPI000A023056|nr:hypothetical protein [Henriciella aquimarina]